MDKTSHKALKCYLSQGAEVIPLICLFFRILINRKGLYQPNNRVLEGLQTASSVFTQPTILVTRTCFSK